MEAAGQERQVGCWWVQGLLPPALRAESSQCLASPATLQPRQLDTVSGKLPPAAGPLPVSG